MRKAPDKQWDHCKALLGQRIGQEDATAWLDDLRLETLTPGRIVLSGIPNSFFKNRIQRRFREQILTTIGECFPEVALTSGPELELRVQTDPPPALSKQTPPTSQSDISRDDTPASQDAQPAPLAEENTVRFMLDAFIPAPCNESAFRFAKMVAREPGRRFNPLMLVGATGLGKSHLLQGIAHALRTERPGWRVVYSTGESFRNQVLEGITRRRMTQVREFYRSADALIVDNVEFLLVSPRAQEELLHTVDLLHGSGRQLVFSADRYPRTLPGMSDGLRSRLEMGLVTELNFPDADTRRRLVQAKAAEEGLELPAEVSRLLADRVTRNLRQLTGAVVRLEAYAAMEGQPITLEFAERVAAPFFDRVAGRGDPVGPDAVLEGVADRFGLTIRGLKGRGRSPNIVSARRVAIHLLKTLSALSYPEVGSLLGNRSHSTVIHGHQTLLGEMKQDEQLARMVQQLGQTLSATSDR